MSFQQKYEEFKAVEGHYNAIIRELEDKIADLESKLALGLPRLERAIREDLEKGTKQTKAEVSKIKASNDANRSELVDIKARLDIARNMKKEKLRGLLPELKKEKDKLTQEAQKEIDSIKSQALERKAEYLLYIASIDKPRKEAQKATAQLMKAARTAEVPDYNREFVRMNDLDLVTPFVVTGKMPLAPTDAEILDAYRLGKLPAYVKYYQLTGEIVPETEARRRLEELKRKGKQN